MVGWDSANSPNANTLFGISDGWTAIAVAYSGDIYITTVEKNAWEHVNAPASFMPKSGGTFTGNVKARTDTATTGSYLRNISVKSNSTDVSTMSIYFTRE